MNVTFIDLHPGNTCRIVTTIWPKLVSQFNQSDWSEVVGFLQEVEGKPLHFILLFWYNQNNDIKLLLFLD